MYSRHLYKSDLAGPACVYRAFIGDELAYVGVSWQPERRFLKHRSQKPWWSDVDHIDIEWFDSREDAFAAERVAIHNENPVYNLARPAVV